MSQSNFEPIEAIGFPLRFDAELKRHDKERDYARYVRGLILQVLHTAPGERINRPRFGTPIARSVFAPLSGRLSSLIEARVRHALETYLANFITIEEISSRQKGENTLIVEISYHILATKEDHFLEMEVA